MTIRSLIAKGIFAGTVTLLVAGPASSQEAPTVPSPIPVGSRIRLRARAVEARPIVGMVLQVDGTSLLVGRDGRPPVKVAHQAITQLEVSTSRRRQTLKGLLIGASLGTLAGLASPCLPMVGCDWHNRGGAAMTFGASGATWGTLVGTMIRRDHWNPVALDQLRGARVGAPAPGVGLSVSISFR